MAASADEAGDLNRFLLGVYQDLSGEIYLMTSEEGGPTGTSGEVFAVVAADRSGGAPAVWWIGGAVALVLLVLIAMFVARQRARTAGEERAP